MIKTAVIGASGFIGRHLWNAYRRVDPDTVGTCFSRTQNGLIPFDLRTPNLAALDLSRQGYRSVLISAAKPNVGYCEQNPEESRAVNVDGMKTLIRQIADAGMQVVFLSSDYVFDGMSGSYPDDALTNPCTEYGRQKQAIEQELPRVTDNYLILRLSKTYGVIKGDGTLLDEIASTLARGGVIRAAFDQFFSPTLVADLVKAVLKIQQLGLRGVFNVCSPQIASRFEVAESVARALGIREVVGDRLQKVSLHDLPGMSNRPLNTSLLPERLISVVGTTFTPLDVSVARVAEQWRGELAAI